ALCINRAARFVRAGVALPGIGFQDHGAGVSSLDRLPREDDLAFHRQELVQTIRAAAARSQKYHEASDNSGADPSTSSHNVLLSRRGRDHGTATASLLFIVARARYVGRAMRSLMKRTEPSAIAKLRPPACRLRKA